MFCMENSQTIREQKEKVYSNIKDEESYLHDFNQQHLEIALSIDSLVPYEKEWANFQEAKSKEDKIDREISGLINKFINNGNRRIS